MLNLHDGKKLKYLLLGRDRANSFLLSDFPPEMAYAVPYIQDVETMPLDEHAKYIVRMAREANDNLLEDTSASVTQGIGAWVHYCPFAPAERTPTTREQQKDRQYWLSALNGVIYNGVARNDGWKYCRRCNPEQRPRHEVRDRIAGKKILRYLRRKVPIIKFKRSTTTFAALHLRRGLPADVVGKILSH